MSHRTDAAQLAQILEALPADAPQRPDLLDRLHRESTALLDQERYAEVIAEKRRRQFIENEQRYTRRCARLRPWRTTGLAAAITTSVLVPGVLLLFAFLTPSYALGLLLFMASATSALAVTYLWTCALGC